MISTPTLRLFVFLVGLACLICVPSFGQQTPASIPAWRGKSPGTAYLGPDVLWRPRERMLFLMRDDRGTGFTLTVTTRDMNTYLQGARPVMVWVTGPNSETVARAILPDDGIISGNDRYKDGIYDPWQDFRYREWHRVHSPDGIPVGKARSPFLTHPEQLPARTLTVRVPAAGKGLYRVLVIASWDHWISLTPDRPLMTGVHPGAGPLYVHGSVLREAYLYTLPNANDLAFSVSEEIQPYNWQLQVEEANGTVVGRTTPRTFINACIVKQAARDAVYRLRLTGTTTGACLHLWGTPMLLCPDAVTANTLHGGAEVDARGRVTFHRQARVLNAWLDTLTPDKLNVTITKDKVPARYADLLTVLAKQDLTPASPTYGQFRDVDTTIYTAWDPVVDHLARAAGDHAADNGLYAHPGIIRRILLARLRELTRLSNYYWFDGDTPWQAPADPAHAGFWDVIPQRSSYFGLASDITHIASALPLRDVLDAVLPQDVVAAWKSSCDNWAYARAFMHNGECSNQWCMNISGIANIYQFTHTPAVRDILDQQIGALTLPGGNGRMNPDLVYGEVKSTAGITCGADSGAIGCGALAEGLGFDAEYCNESVMFIEAAWQATHDPRLTAWWDRYLTLKAYLALPGTGDPGAGPLVCPTDMSHRTPYASAYIRVPADAEALVPATKLWGTNLPCLRQDAFTRIIDHQFYFINTPGYYATAYTGGTTMAPQTFEVTEVKDGSARCTGYAGMDYGGMGYKSTKIGGISAIYVRNCGPTLLCNNGDVYYSNVVWGRRKTPLCEQWDAKLMDPYIICSGYSDPIATFDAKGRVLRTSGTFEYAPLAFTRTVHFRDDRIVVTLELTALDDLDLAELNEAIPFYATGRVVKPYGDDFRDGQPLNVSDITAGTVLPLRALDIAAASGAGTTVLFEQLQSCTPVAKPWELSRNGGLVSSISVPLAAHMKAGQTQQLRYVLLSHQQPITTEALRKAAGE